MTLLLTCEVALDEDGGSEDGPSLDFRVDCKIWPSSSVADLDSSRALCALSVVIDLVSVSLCYLLSSFL